MSFTPIQWCNVNCFLNNYNQPLWLQPYIITFTFKCRDRRTVVLNCTLSGTGQSTKIGYKQSFTLSHRNVTTNSIKSYSGQERTIHQEWLHTTFHLQLQELDNKFSTKLYPVWDEPFNNRMVTYNLLPSITGIGIKIIKLYPVRDEPFI